MQIDFDQDKRDKALTHRGVDFARAAEVFVGRHFTAEDTREDYSELRYITVGKLDGRMVDAMRRSAPHYQHEESQ